jgi:hypothetical protein
MHYTLLQLGSIKNRKKKIWDNIPEVRQEEEKI